MNHSHACRTCVVLFRSFEERVNECRCDCNRNWNWDWNCAFSEWSRPDSYWLRVSVHSLTRLNLCWCWCLLLLLIRLIPGVCQDWEGWLLGRARARAREGEETREQNRRHWADEWTEGNRMGGWTDRFLAHAANVDVDIDIDMNTNMNMNMNMNEYEWTWMESWAYSETLPYLPTYLFTYLLLPEWIEVTNLLSDLTF